MMRVPMLNSIRDHWPEYLMEAWGLGVFMISACVFTVLVNHPASPLQPGIEDPLARRALIGLAMGTTAVAIITSPWGRRSGAHINPAVTLAYLSLGKIGPSDALLYIASQFAGAAAGVQAAAWLIGPPVGHSAVNFVATLPGSPGPWAAFAAEAFISALLLTVVLWASNHRTLAPWTPYLVGTLVALYITVEAPISGMSMNPARTFGSGLFANAWNGAWIYFTAPPLGMLAAAQLFRIFPGEAAILCAKLDHHNNQTRCIFRCNYGALHAGRH
jgi:aquaporin Z